MYLPCRKMQPPCLTLKVFAAGIKSNFRVRHPDWRPVLRRSTYDSTHVDIVELESARVQLVVSLYCSASQKQCCMRQKKAWVIAVTIMILLLPNNAEFSSTPPTEQHYCIAYATQQSQHHPTHPSPSSSPFFVRGAHPLPYRNR